MNLANESWKVFDPTYSKTYLHDADTKLLNHLTSRILCSGNDPKILDIESAMGLESPRRLLESEKSKRESLRK